MEKEIFDLLLEISKTGNIIDFTSKTTTNREQIKLDIEKERRFNVLIKHGLISNNGNNVFIITEYGYDVAQYNSWKEYLECRKLILNDKLRKDKYDLNISWFQSKTKWWPLAISALSLGISIWAITKDKKGEEKSTPHRNKEHIQASLDSSTKSIPNEKVVDTGTYHLSNQEKKQTDQ